jgi:hypothetical protein
MKREASIKVTDVFGEGRLMALTGYECGTPGRTGQALRVQSASRESRVQQATDRIRRLGEVVPATRQETSDVGRLSMKALPALEPREGSSFRSAARRYLRTKHQSL